jgi:chemotaxis protein CheZ
MSDLESLRRDIVAMVKEMRCTLQDIGDQGLPEANVVSDARDRLRYISSLTEQAAGQTLSAAEAIAERLHNQRQRAGELVEKTRSPEIRAFLLSLSEEHRQSAADTSEIIQAQEFQDLVGQVINKLLTMVQNMEDNLVHLIVDDAPETTTLSGPALNARTRISQDDVDDLFG